MKSLFKNTLRFGSLLLLAGLLFSTNLVTSLVQYVSGPTGDTAVGAFNPYDAHADYYIPPTGNASSPGNELSTNGDACGADSSCGDTGSEE